MRRRLGDEKVQPWRKRINGPAAERLCNEIREWSSNEGVTPTWPDIPEEIQDRDADVWEALLAVADLAGERWATSAREAAVTLVTASRERKPSLGVVLLADVRKVFDGCADDKLPTEEILSALNKIDEAPWATIRRGEPMDSRSLANRLGKYGIGSKPQRDGERVFKGYARAQFEDAWKRYVPDSIGSGRAGCGRSATPGDFARPRYLCGYIGYRSTRARPCNRCNRNRTWHPEELVRRDPQKCPRCSLGPANASTGMCDFCEARQRAINAQLATLTPNGEHA
jgi:hypothetical protein